MSHYARFRPRLTKLTLPWIWLGVISAALSFESTYKLPALLNYTTWAVGGVLAVFLFIVPALRYSATYFDIHSGGLSLRLGLGSEKRVEVSWSEISSVTVSALKGINLKTKDEREFNLRGYNNQRAIVAELAALLGRK
jgi:hypothetical protein